jgi:hypothetical protein
MDKRGQKTKEDGSKGRSGSGEEANSDSDSDSEAAYQAILPRLPIEFTKRYEFATKGARRYSFILGTEYSLTLSLFHSFTH